MIMLLSLTSRALLLLLQLNLVWMMSYVNIGLINYSVRSSIHLSSVINIALEIKQYTLILLS